MALDSYHRKARTYVDTLCAVRPNRRTGSAGNREAVTFFAETIRPWGLELDEQPFECLDHLRGNVALTRQERAFEVAMSPYSPGCDVTAELVGVSTVEELERVACQGRILLMRGGVCSEQLMPKLFPFYNPEHHQRIVALLEAAKPEAIITATGANPDQVGALDPFPLIVDGDFDIPSVYCRESVGEELAQQQGGRFRLQIDARRVPSTASNVVARLNPQARDKIVVTAHIDGYEDSPGALDNASGTAVLLLLAEMLAGYRGRFCVEIAALNGEDHYSAAGQRDYLARYGGELDRVRLAVNVDDVGYRQGRSAFSMYGCPVEVKGTARVTFEVYPGLVEGEAWYSGDHMIFVQQGVPALALTAAQMPELMRTVTHTSRDAPELVDEAKLVEVARALEGLVRALA